MHLSAFVNAGSNKGEKPSISQLLATLLNFIILPGFLESLAKTEKARREMQKMLMVGYMLMLIVEK